MKKRMLKISLFILLISVCAYCFFSSNDKSIEVHAANQTWYDCYNLLYDENNSYEANVASGKVSGAGAYLLGDKNIELTATANSNYQLSGWKVVYDEQSERFEYFDVTSMLETSEVKLTPTGVTQDEDKISATIVIEKENGYVKSGTFKLADVFEDMSIIPVFDHIYYNVNIDELIDITNHKNSIEIENSVVYESEDSNEDSYPDLKVVRVDTLFFNEANTATTFNNAYIKTSYKNYTNNVFSYESEVHYNFFQTLHKDELGYYTLHETLEAEQKNQRIDYIRGAYRIGDEVNLAFDVDINPENIYASKNIDFKSVNIISAGSNPLSVYDAQNPKNEYYSIVQDDFWRTKSYNINFIIKNETSYVNTIDVNYHNLFVADINLLVDGDDEHEDRDYILGEVSTGSNQLTSNVNISNYYYLIDEEDLLFFVKTSANNNAKSFMVSSVENVNALKDGTMYSYFTFDSLNGGSNTSQLFSNITDNLTIDINYLSVTHNIDFEFAELVVGKQDNQSITNLNFAGYTAFELKRRESISPEEFNAEVGKNNIPGYTYVGYVNSLTDSPNSLQTTFNYMVDPDRPTGKTIVLCYKKIDYNISLNNYNTVKIGSLVALESFTITKTNVEGVSIETLMASGDDALLNPMETSHALKTKIKLGDSVSISKTVNTGFNVKFSLLDPETIENLKATKTDEQMEEYFITNFDLDLNFISNLSLGYGVFKDYEKWESVWQELYIYDSSSREFVLNESETRDENETYYLKSIIIYVYEEKVDYTITYQTAVLKDGNNNDYVMAKIDVDESTIPESVNVEYYGLDGNVVANNVVAISKIVVSGLHFNDVITLKSNGLPFNNTTYVFNWFIVGGNTELTGYKVAATPVDFYNCDETVRSSRTIDVVYTIPVATVLVSIDEDFSDLAETQEDLSGLYEITSFDEINRLSLNTYSINIGTIINIEILNDQIPNGYEFIGYQIDQGKIQEVDGFIFEYTTISGGNKITLKFQRIIYQFHFIQFGEPFDNVENEEDRYIQFGEKSYSELTVNNSTLTIQKPLGYYVANVRFGTRENVLNNSNLLEKYSTDLSENNSYRSNNNILNYSFNLTKDQLISLIDPEDIEHYQGSDPNNDAIIDVYVRIDYLIFTYEATVNFDLENPKQVGENKFYVPLLQLTYVFNGSAVVVNYPYSNKTVTFEEIPYGAESTTINVLSGAQPGLSVVGWRYTNNAVIDRNDYTYSNSSIVLGTITESKSFKYLFSYNKYKLNLNYVSSLGNPIIYINNNITELKDAKLTLYDKVQIEAGADRKIGYTFDHFSYKKIEFILASINQNNWDEFKNRLYVLNDKIYTKIEDQTFDEHVDYFVRKEIEIVYNKNQFLDLGEFIVEDYLISDQGEFTVNIQYKLLELDVENKVLETGIGILFNSGKGNHKIAFEKEELIIFEIEDVSNPDREVDKVTVADSLKVHASINPNAKNYYNGTNFNTFDLTKGLKIASVQIGGLIAFAPTLKDGKYSFVLNVGQYLNDGDEGDVIKISYTLSVEEKNVQVTTNVNGSASDFYKNIRMFIDSSVYGFSEDALESGNRSQIEMRQQFLAKVKLTASLGEAINPSYKVNFKVVGVKVYEMTYQWGSFVANSEAIDPENYQTYGIELPEYEGGTSYTLDVRMLSSLKVEFQIEPVLTFNNGPYFIKEFMCSVNGNQIQPVSQALTIGETNAFDIQIASELKSSVIIKYKQVGLNPELLDQVANIGVYDVIIRFENNDNFKWLSDITIGTEIKLEIIPKELTLSYYSEFDEFEHKITRTSKTYDGESGYAVDDNILKALKFTGKNGFLINYCDVLDSADGYLKLDRSLSGMQAYITNAGKGGHETQASTSVYYNLFIGQIALEDKNFNKNFNLKTQELVIMNFIQILPKEVELTEFIIYNKVFDNTDKAELMNVEDIKITNRVKDQTEDDVSLDASKLVLKFEDYSVGEGKTVYVDASKALKGNKASNYKISNFRIFGGTIYPYSISCSDKGLGNVQLINKRGLTEKDKVNLIPLNAVLHVEAIYPESVEYANIYKHIQGYVKGNREFAIGYKFILMVNGREINIDKNLYISIPNVKNLTNAYYLTGTQTGSIKYEESGNNLIIDLNQIETDVNTIFITQRRILLESWQIVLIVVISAMVIAGVVLTFVLLRKRKNKEYSIHEKI